MVAGGIAVNLYGIERATADIDIVVALSEENIERFISVANAVGLKPKIPEKLESLLDEDKRKRWVDEKGLLVFSLFDPANPFFLLDVMIEIPFNFDQVYPDRNELSYENTVIPLIPLDELIAMKEKAGRPQDMSDVYHLRKIREAWNNET